MIFQLNKILSYINENYEEQAIIRPNVLNYPYTIYIPSKKYDLEIKLIIPGKKHYLYGKCQYALSFGFNANKKYKSELDYHGGGYSEEYKENNYSNIDKFLSEFCSQRKYKQMNLFD